MPKAAKAPWEMIPKVGFSPGVHGRWGERDGGVAGRERVTVRMVSKDVFAGWGEDLGAVEASWEVGSEQRPDLQGSKIFRAAGEGTGMGRGRK